MMKCLVQEEKQGRGHLCKVPPKKSNFLCFSVDTPCMYVQLSFFLHPKFKCPLHTPSPPPPFLFPPYSYKSILLILQILNSMKNDKGMEFWNPNYINCTLNDENFPFFNQISIIFKTKRFSLQLPTIGVSQQNFF